MIFQLVLLLLEQDLLHALRLRKLVQLLRDAAQLSASGTVRLTFLRLTAARGLHLSASPIVQAARIGARGRDGRVHGFGAVILDRFDDRFGERLVSYVVGQDAG